MEEPVVRELIVTGPQRERLYDLFNRVYAGRRDVRVVMDRRRSPALRLVTETGRSTACASGASVRPPGSSRLPTRALSVPERDASRSRRRATSSRVPSPTRIARR